MTCTVRKAGRKSFLLWMDKLIATLPSILSSWNNLFIKQRFLKVIRIKNHDYQIKNYNQNHRVPERDEIGSRNLTRILQQGYIFCKILWWWGGGEMATGEKNENWGCGGKKLKRREKGKGKKGLKRLKNGLNSSLKKKLKKFRMKYDT